MISVEINPINVPHNFPVFRQWKDEPKLIVLFTSCDTGVALSGVESHRIGVPETWKDVSDPKWIPCKIVIS